VVSLSIVSYVGSPSCFWFKEQSGSLVSFDAHGHTPCPVDLLQEHNRASDHADAAFYTCAHNQLLNQTALVTQRSLQDIRTILVGRGGGLRLKVVFFVCVTLPSIFFLDSVQWALVDQNTTSLIYTELLLWLGRIAGLYQCACVFAVIGTVDWCNVLCHSASDCDNADTIISECNQCNNLVDILIHVRRLSILTLATYCFYWVLNCHFTAKCYTMGITKTVYKSK